MTSAVFPVLLEGAGRALAAALAVWVGLRLLRVRNVPAQKAAWTLVLVAALAMPALMRWQWLPAANNLRPPTLSWGQVANRHAPPARSAPASAFSAAPTGMAEPSAATPGGFAAPSITEPVDENAGLQGTDPHNAESASTRRENTGLGAAAAVPEPQPPASRPWPVRALTFAWLLYLAVAATLLLRLIAGLAAALRIWFSATPIPAALLADFAPGASVRSSARVASPVNIGSGIVLPADFPSWDAEKLRIVLAHERSHVRQGDFYLQLLAGVYAVICWFSPLGWWLKRKLSELGEAIGDRAGLEQAASRASYAELLLEFASLPRPILTGVAMARKGNLAPRIERLLNESSFRQAFAAGRRRAVLAILVVLAALFASAALVRVEAASQTQPQTTPAPLAAQDQSQTPPATGVSKPPDQPITDQTQDQGPAPPPPAAAPAQPPVPQATPRPMPPAAPNAAPVPEAAPAPPAPPAPGEMTVPPLPPLHVQVPPIPPMPNLNAEINSAIRAQTDAMRSGIFRDYSRFDADGDGAWALVNGPGDSQTHLSRSAGIFGGSRAEIDKARKMAHGPFFWFEHDGKSYIVEDPSIVAEVGSIEKPLGDLRSQMRALSKQQRDLGRQLRNQVRQQRQAAIPKPDLSKEMAELNAAVASLKSSQGNTISRDQLMQLQMKIAKIQGQLGRLESGFYAGLYAKDGAWGKWREQESRLGGEQGRLAGELVRMSLANRGKIDAIIGQALKDGKAKPVQ